MTKFTTYTETHWAVLLVAADAVEHDGGRVPNSIAVYPAPAHDLIRDGLVLLGGDPLIPVLSLTQQGVAIAAELRKILATLGFIPDGPAVGRWANEQISGKTTEWSFMGDVATAPLPPSSPESDERADTQP